MPISQAIIDVTLEEEERPLALSLFTGEQMEETTPGDPRPGWFSRALGRIERLLPPEQRLREYEKLLEKGSLYEQTIRPVFQYARYVLLGELGEKATKGLGDWYFFTPGVRYLTDGYYGHLAERPDPDPLEVMVDFHDQLRARGIQLLVIPIPGKASVYPDFLVASATGPEVSANTERFRARLNKRGVVNLDLHLVSSARRGPPGMATRWMEIPCT